MMDFIRPLKEDSGYNCIFSIMDHLGADIRIIPACTDISAKNLAIIFFNRWYCKNVFPLNIISDHDKLFMLRFWKMVTTLCGVKLKMLTTYHPNTNGSSKQTDKTINKCLCFHIDCQQKGWVQELPRIHFAIMNLVNTLSGFSNFQLHLDCTPHVIPPMEPLNFLPTLCSSSPHVKEVISCTNLDVSEVCNNLSAAKAFQAHYANTSHGVKIIYTIRDHIMSSTF